MYSVANTANQNAWNKLLRMQTNFVWIFAYCWSQGCLAKAVGVKLSVDQNIGTTERFSQLHSFCKNGAELSSQLGAGHIVST